MSNLTSEQQVRVRFAPSPTGFLHIGGVRTALFNWLYAKNKGGKFLLRIEDTDLERSEERFTHDFLASLKWLGLTWDEEPLYQSRRLDLYRNKAESLIAKGFAYRCYCSEQDVEQMRQKAMAEGKKPQYDRRCRNLNHPHRDQGYVIRAKIPLEGFTEFHDLIRGPIRFENTDIDDFVLIRSNGAPTYNLSVVVDDVDSRITHILRGDDHINNTPKQIQLYQFFSSPVPQFAHLSMILGPDKKKLSKRHGAVSANAYRSEGYLPEALLNFLARLGWSHGDQEIFSIQEMVQYFSFDHVQKSSAVFNLEKLLWLNGAHLRTVEPKRIISILEEDYSDQLGPDVIARLKTELGEKLVHLIQPKVKLLKEMADQVIPLCTLGAIEVDGSELKLQKDENLKKVTKTAVRHLIEVLGKKMEGHREKAQTPRPSSWANAACLEDAGVTSTDVDQILRSVGEQHGLKLGDLAQPIRLVITGRLASAGLFELLSMLPWEMVEARLGRIETL